MTPRKNRVDRFLERLKKKPIVAASIALGTVVIALSTFTDSVRNLAGLATALTGPSAEEARAELTRLSVDYSKERFLERVQQGDEVAAELFLTAGMDANAAVDQEGNTALMVAASNGRTSIVDGLVRAGANVNATNREGVSVLMRAATQGDLTIVRTLIEAKADLDHKDARGDTALSFAAARGQRQNVTLLLDSGARPEAIDRAFVAAARFGQPDMARLLLERGADVKKVGAEALVRAITQDRSSTVNDNVTFLVDVVGDLSAQDVNGWSGVHLAASRGNAALMRLLLEKGAEVNRACVCHGYLAARDWTPLQMAARRGRAEIVELLLAKGADHRPANSRGATALHLAVESDTPAIVRALLERGADAAAKDVEGKTPLDYATEIPDEKTRSEIVQMLKEGGAPGTTRRTRKEVSAHRIVSRKLEPTLRQSKTCNPRRDAICTQTSVPRQLLPYGSSRGEYVPIPS
jgi:ankyrin repeat protein